MGDFSVPCGISGIPIKNGQSVVGWKVEPYRFNDQGYYDWIPFCLPVRGFYDNGGSIENEKGETILSPHDNFKIVIVHSELFDSIKDFWDNKHDKFPPMIESINKARKKYKTEVDRIKDTLIMIEKSKMSDEDKQKSKDDFDENNLYLLGRSIDDSDCHKLNLFKYLHSKLCWLGPETEPCGSWSHNGEVRKISKGEAMCRYILESWEYNSDEQKEHIASELEKLLFCYFTTNIRGRQVSTTGHCFTAQYPDYKLENKWRKKTSGLVGKFRKKENEIDKAIKLDDDLQNFDEYCQAIAEKYGLAKCVYQMGFIRECLEMSMEPHQREWRGETYKESFLKAHEEMKELKDYDRFGHLNYSEFEKIKGWYK